MLKGYVGAKIILAEPATKMNNATGALMPGYRVVYPDGYESWSPSGTFEQAYREVSPEERAMLDSYK